MFRIYATTENQVVTFVGCTRGNIPTGSVLLQEVEHQAELCWVKWSMRFRRTIEDKTALAHPYSAYFRNSSRLKALLEDEEFRNRAAALNRDFLEFHENNAPVFRTLIQTALAKKKDGQPAYSMDQLLGEIRWGDTQVTRTDDRVKINACWSAWYSRAVQMVEPELLGFFQVRSGMADTLEWIDGKAWREFAAEHEDKIDWRDPFAELPDSPWEYTK